MRREKEKVVELGERAGTCLTPCKAGGTSRE